MLYTPLQQNLRSTLKDVYTVVGYDKGRLKEERVVYKSDKQSNVRIEWERERERKRDRENGREYVAKNALMYGLLSSTFQFVFQSVPTKWLIPLHQLR